MGDTLAGESLDPIKCVLQLLPMIGGLMRPDAPVKSLRPRP